MSRGAGAIHIVSSEGYIEARIKKAKTHVEESSSWEDADYSVRRGRQLPGPALACEDRYYEYDHTAHSYPAVNIATGLPMQGGGSMFDVGGNVFGTNPDLF